MYYRLFIKYLGLSLSYFYEIIIIYVDQDNFLSLHQIILRLIRNENLSPYLHTLEIK